MRPALCPKRKFAAFLNYLASGDTHNSVAHKFALGESSMVRIIKEVGSALIENMMPRYGCYIKSERYIKEAEERFRNHYNWPGVYGAIDGTHVRVNRNEEILTNRKGYNSIACLCVADSDLRCSYYRIGDCGSVHDARMWQNSDLYHNLQSADCPASIMVTEVRDLPLAFN